MDSGLRRSSGSSARKTDAIITHFARNIGVSFECETNNCPPTRPDPARRERSRGANGRQTGRAKKRGKTSPLRTLSELSCELSLGRQSPEQIFIIPCLRRLCCQLLEVEMVFIVMFGCRARVRKVMCSLFASSLRLFSQTVPTLCRSPHGFCAECGHHFGIECNEIRATARSAGKKNADCASPSLRALSLLRRPLHELQFHVIPDASGALRC